MSNYIDIESTSGLNQTVKQSLKFKTGNFIWRIRFNTPLDPKTVNNQNLYVTSPQAQLKTSISYNALQNEIEIEPLEPYIKEQTYTLHITTNVKSKGGKPLRNEVSVQFRL